MDRCLTQHQIDVALVIAFAGGCVALVAALASVMAWLPASAFRPQPKQTADRIASTVSMLICIGALVSLAVRGQVWMVVVVVATMLASVPAVLLARQRSIASSADTELTPAWRRRSSAIKYGGLTLAVVGALVALGAMVWVIPAELC